jgi:hypothetical protein
MKGFCAKYSLYPKFTKLVFLPDLSDETRVPGDIPSALAEMGRSIGAGRFPVLEQLDEMVARAYAIPLSTLRGEAVPIGLDYDTIIKFHRFAERWKAETAHLSNIAQKAIHPAYQAIIGMGRKAVPLILAELGKQPKQWFWALNAITGADPVPEESRGRVREMASAWLRWGRDRGYRV